jgi:hypothetical protein
MVPLSPQPGWRFKGFKVYTVQDLVGHLPPMHSSIALIYHAVLATEWPISWQMTH